MTKVGEIVQKLDVIKKRYLQLEYLGLLGNFHNAYNNHLGNPENIAGIKSSDELKSAIDDEISHMEEFIPVLIREFLDSCDYNDYTQENHGNKFWNEIDSPARADTYFNALVSIIGYEPREGDFYEISLYDIHPNSLYFNSLTEVEEMLSTNDLAPCTVYHTSSGKSEELYNI